MVRSLWSAATGMNAQQTNVDTIANNLANVNSAGYKAQKAQFKSLLYQTLQSTTTTANGEPKPTTSQVGLGVRTSSINNIYTQGSLLSHKAIRLSRSKGTDSLRYEAMTARLYTRNGDFTWAIGTNGGMTLTNQDGLPVLSSAGRAITLNRTYIANRISISQEGEVCYPDGDNNPQPIGVKIGVYQFSNAGGLERYGDTLDGYRRERKGNQRRHE